MREARMEQAGEVTGMVHPAEAEMDNRAMNGNAPAEATEGTEPAF